VKVMLAKLNLSAKPVINQFIKSMNLQKTSKNSNAANRLTAALFIVYLLVLCWVLLFKLGVRFSYMENRSVSLVPFSKLLVANGRADISEIILNVVIFVPLGIYAGILFYGWRLGRKILLFFFTSLIVEGLQFVLAVGAFDITDIITNTLGGMIGLALFEVIERVINDRLRAQKIINIIAAIATVLMIGLLLLLKLNMLPIRYQ
jgi:glycopeptide antibiotics resistance protein